MSDNFLINDEILDWLLELSNPSVRYWTLKDLINLEPSDPIIVKAQDEIMTSSCLEDIFSKQIEEKYWGKTDDMYNPKYVGTTHNLLILAELGSKLNSRIRNAIEFIYQFQRSSGHFLINLPKSQKGRESTIKDACCIDGNILTYLIHFGYFADPRTQKLINFIVDDYDKSNGGWKCRAYSGDMKLLFPKNCYMGRMKVLKGISFIPRNKLSKELKTIIEKESEEILENHIWKYMKNSDGSRKEKLGWKNFGFPLFYNSDVLELLDIFGRLGIQDERINEGIELILSKRQKNGKWLLKNSFNGKMDCIIEEKNKPSKWITLRAMRVLKAYTHEIEL